MDYTDDELYQLLDVSPSVSNRELETIITEKIKKYNHCPELRNFFNQVYDHFFLTMEGPEEAETEGFTNKDKDKDNKEKDKPLLTAALPFSKDNLNPLLNQSIKKIISIDSQYRDIHYPYSTQFTFDLNEPLKDVVSLKLYSIGIPYTWYTINRDYGSNFILLQGIIPGIDDGQHDFVVDISSGNYSPNDLVNTINNSFRKLQILNPEVNFGTTAASYNTFTSLSKFNIDLSYRFGNQDYKVFMPSSTDSTPPADTLFRYLGLKDNNYPYYIDVSSSGNFYLQRIESSLIQNNGNEDDVNAIYLLDSTNNYFQIIQYQSQIVETGNGTGIYTTTAYDVSSVITTLTVPLSLPFGTYTRNALKTALKTALNTNTSLYNSDLVTLMWSPSSEYQPYEQYTLSLVSRLNNKIISTLPNAKTVIQFPEESSPFPIWTGTNSCFQWLQTFNELCETHSTNPLKQTNYIINNQPILYLKCDLSGYDNSFNDFTVRVANSLDPINGYSLAGYLQAINDAFHITAFSSNYEFVDISGILIDPTTSIPALYIDINKIFRTTDYNIDFTDSILNTTFNIFYNATPPFDISGSLQTKQTFVGQLPIQSQYNIPKGKPLFTILPRITALQNMDPYYVNFQSSSDISTNDYWIYTDHAIIASDINASLQAFQEPLEAGATFPLKATTVYYNSLIENNSFVLNLAVSVSKIINQTSYTMYLYDASGGNSWNSQLHFSQNEYILSQQPNVGPITKIQATSPVNDNSITLFRGINDYFFIEPLTDVSGLITSTQSPDNAYYYTFEGGEKVGYPYNYIRINIPDQQYNTYTQLLSAINTALSANPLTKGSYISIKNQNYVKIRWNINKNYSASDYQMVFYDNVSFVKCYIGDNSVRNTTWDTTLGWILGFHEKQKYELSNYIDASGIAVLEGDTSVNTNLYNYLLLSLDDYNQNRLNDGVVTITKNETKLPLPSYANQAILTCDASGNKIATSAPSVAVNSLTLKQLYSINQVLNAQQNPIQTYTAGPFVKDIFGVIPLKLNGLQNGQIYSEFGGTLQQQERQYFGPVNIHRMSITLYTDKGTVLDLNGNNWNFSFVAECLYQKQKL